MTGDTQQQIGVNNTKGLVGKSIIVEREIVQVDEVSGKCIEVNDSGVLVKYKHRGNVVTDFIPWEHAKRVRYLESEKIKHVNV